uniref:Uncharacterized protein n=1 Tax=Rhizophora mucronata TaxID=61149 RepID=A0A2P2NV23_RHIMU
MENTACAYVYLKRKEKIKNKKSIYY